MTSDFTPTQGQYLAFIYNYTVMHDAAPAEVKHILLLTAALH